eukprot:GHVS01086370.1.p1 GENE.GHVS01086370.1~~GHVS01086370.1.p1  ORF type:complete len:702 (-),score=123.65 GHVS01086370.1:131-2236(-)
MDPTTKTFPLLLLHLSSLRSFPPPFLRLSLRLPLPVLPPLPLLWPLPPSPPPPPPPTVPKTQTLRSPSAAAVGSTRPSPLASAHSDPSVDQPSTSSLSRFLSPIFASLRLPHARCAQIRQTLADADIFCLRTLLRYARSVTEIQSLVPDLSPVLSRLIVHKLNSARQSPQPTTTNTTDDIPSPTLECCYWQPTTTTPSSPTANVEWPIFSLPTFQRLPLPYRGQDSFSPYSLDHALFSSSTETKSETSGGGGSPRAVRWAEGFCSGQVYRKLATPCEMGGDENCSMTPCGNKEASAWANENPTGSLTDLIDSGGAAARTMRARLTPGAKEVSKKALSRRFFTPKKGPLPQSARRALPTSQKNDVKKIVENIQQKHPLQSDDVAVCWDYSDLQWRAKLRFKADGEIQQFTRPPVDYTQTGLLEARQLLMARVKQYIDDRQANGPYCQATAVVRKSASKIRQLAAVPCITHTDWRPPMTSDSRDSLLSDTTATTTPPPPSAPAVVIGGGGCVTIGEAAGDGVKSEVGGGEGLKGRKRGRPEVESCSGEKKEENGGSRKRLYGSGVCLYTTVQRRAMPKAFKEEVQQIAEDLKLECEKARNREDENRWHCRWEFRDMQWRGCLKTGKVPVHFTRAPYDMTRPAMKAALDFIVRRIQMKRTELGSPLYRVRTVEQAITWNLEESSGNTSEPMDKRGVKLEDGETS